MFVKGETVGATVGTDGKASAAKPDAAKPAAAAAAKFNWKRAIRDALRDAPDGELRLKRLRAAVLKQHAACEGAAGGESESSDAARATFKKRLKKMTGVQRKGKTQC